MNQVRHFAGLAQALRLDWIVFHDFFAFSMFACSVGPMLSVIFVRAVFRIILIVALIRL